MHLKRRLVGRQVSLDALNDFTWQRHLTEKNLRFKFKLQTRQTLLKSAHDSNNLKTQFVWGFTLIYSLKKFPRGEQMMMMETEFKYKTLESQIYEIVV